MAADAALARGHPPLTAGFIGKFYLFTSGVDTALWAPLWSLVIGSVIGLFYYLRAILALFSSADVPTGAQRAGLAGSFAPAGLTLTLAWLGVWPSRAIAAVRWAMLPWMPG